MKKKYTNVNEEVNRIKELFTEERLYGNLILENVEECGAEDTRLKIIKDILNEVYKISNIEFDKDSTGCYLYVKIVIGNVKHKLFFWESRWFKYIKELVDGGVFIDEDKKMKQRVYSGVYYLIPLKKDIFFNYYIKDQYTDENNKIIKLPETKQTNMPSFEILYGAINKEKIELQKKEKEKKELEIKTSKDFKIDDHIKRINELLSGVVTEDELVYVKNILNIYKNSKDLCDLRFKYIENYEEDFYNQISDVWFNTNLKREILDIINNVECEKYKK